MLLGLLVWILATLPAGDVPDEAGSTPSTTHSGDGTATPTGDDLPDPFTPEDTPVQSTAPIDTIPSATDPAQTDPPATSPLPTTPPSTDPPATNPPSTAPAETNPPPASGEAFELPEVPFP